MLKKQKRIDSFAQLGERLAALLLDEDTFAPLALRAGQHNSWFTPKHCRIAFEGIVRMLDEAALHTWANAYPEPTQPRTVGVIMAGNIPLVGFHDFLSVLISGHILRAKLSSQDPFLLKEVTGWLLEIEPAFATFISFEDQMKGVDALIATGSDNSARYFEHYFRHVPHVIRKNRVSCAVLTGTETPEQLDRLADDVLLYYGLGCRNVSKLWLPTDYDPTQLLARWAVRIEEAKEHHKYMNNYDYNRAIYLINSVPHLDGGGLMLKEDTQLVSPISVLYYERYHTLAEVHLHLAALREKIQCVVSHESTVPDAVPFGKAQFPHVTDYADGVDTLQFLTNV